MTIIQFASKDGKVELNTDARTVKLGSQGGTVTGATATVETAGEISRRVTMTRLAATGIFALALKKKKDDRELYLLVDCPQFSFVAQCDPKDGLAARRFAASINSVSRGGDIASGKSSGGRTKARTWSQYGPLEKKIYLWIMGIALLVILIAALTQH